ncbi:MAG: AI-2E family transporter [Oscillospiraceae bacterium]|nr:AI-2E family transporter [Oscillospiraceae bacterium]
MSKKFSGLFSKPWFYYTFALCCAVLLWFFLNNFDSIKLFIGSVWKFISPVVLGLIVAYLLNPVADFFNTKLFFKIKKESARHIWSVIATVFCLVLVLALFLVALIPSLVKSVSSIVSNWDVYTGKINSLLERAIDITQKLNLNFDFSNLQSAVSSLMTRAVNMLKENSSAIMNALGSVGASISNFFIGIVFGVCFLTAKKQLLSFLDNMRRAVIKTKRLEKNNELLGRFNSIFFKYIGCTLIDACIIGGVTFVFALIMRFPYAGLIAFVVGITNIIPTFGPMIGSVIVMFFLVLDKPLNALWFFIFICVWQSIDGMVIKPRLFKGSLGIPGVWTLVLITLGGKIAGMLGIILAVPAAAVFVILYNESIIPRLKKRSEKINADKNPQKAEES